MKKTTLSYLLTAGLASVTCLAQAQFTGDYDNSFSAVWYNGNQNGLGQHLGGIAVTSSGDLYLAGAAESNTTADAVVVKVSGNAQIDSTFSLDGVAPVDPLLGADDHFLDVAVQANGKVVAVGYSGKTSTDADALIARYNADGTLDNTFSSDGIILENPNSALDQLKAVAMDNDKVVVAGRAETGVGSNDYELVIARYNSDGSDDGTFSTVVLNPTIQLDEINDLLVMNDGSIYAVGQQGGNNYLIMKIKSDGTLDSTFSSDGMLNGKVDGKNAVARKIMLHSDGSLLVGGITTDVTDGENAFILNLDAASGNLTTNFGDLGLFIHDFEVTAGTDTIYDLTDMLIMPDGKILVAGMYGTGVDNIGLMLLNSGGTMHTSFGTAGIRTYNLSGGSLANGSPRIALNADSSVYLAGTSWINANDPDVVVKRLLAPTTEPSTNSLGKEVTQQWSIFPNPANQAAQLQLKTSWNESLDMTMIDMTGKTVIRKQINAGSASISLDGLSKGIYFVQLYTRSGSSLGSHKLIIR